MSKQKIEVHVTETDMKMQVIIFSKSTDLIEVVPGEGIHSVQCELLPNANGNTYVGSAVGGA